MTRRDSGSTTKTIQPWVLNLDPFSRTYFSEAWKTFTRMLCLTVSRRGSLGAGVLAAEDESPEEAEEKREALRAMMTSYVDYYLCCLLEN